MSTSTSLAPAPRRPRTVARSRVVSAVLGVVLVAVAAVAYQLSQPVRGFEVTNAPLGRATAYQTGTVQVDDVRVGTSLRRGEESVTTEGVYVVVRVTLRAPTRQDVTVSSVALLSAGPTYGVPTGAGTVTARAGFETSRDVGFEVDPGGLPDLTLELGTVGLVQGYSQHTRTHLGITAANAAQWAAAARGRSVPFDYDEVTRGLA